MAELSPESKVYIKGFDQVLENLSLGHQAVRELFKKPSGVKAELGRLAKVEDRFIPVDQDANVKIRIYTPKEEGPFPIFIYYHGGGWVLGDLETCDATCRLIAELTESVVVSVDYRLSPEYKFPIPVNDCYAALQWVSENAALINGDASTIVVAGDSAGGNMAAVVSMMARDQKGPDISAQVLIYPSTSFNVNTKSFKEFENGFGLTKDLAIWFSNHYIIDDQDKIQKYAAPLMAEDLSHLPPALVIVAENDVLRDDGLAYAKRLKDANVKVESICKKGLVHGYFTYIDIFPEQIKNTISNIARFLLEKNQDRVEHSRNLK
ncbi:MULTISPECIES: alpha/beta hydrolase [Neobacillus]|uniref:Alpha/beta hydrolase n=1 Tax=Neobacillus rhizophilus TaxID=2833579 RepID=A0A942U6C6_9BACI|nr:MULTISPECIES: alpha/beta hydrolase [Neobacillus]MBS4214190.1 alpha/beta hydrolase [Neobacillus rhizophilus]